MNLDATHNLPTEQVLRPPAKAFGYNHLRTNKSIECDAVIIGAGPGGGSVAKVLAEAGLSVLVIESGPAQSRFQKLCPYRKISHAREWCDSRLWLCNDANRSRERRWWLNSH